MVKPIPVLGTLVLIGSIIQVVFGFQVAGGAQGLRDTHMLIGTVGLVLVIALAIIAFRVKTATIYSKATMTILVIVVLVQVIMGFQILGGAQALVVSHEANGFLIVILSLLTGGITFWGAKKRG